MANPYYDIAFTDAVKAAQTARGSRAAYANHEETSDGSNGRLGAREAAFIAERDSFYMATVSETGWPYVQHRGGPKGFLRVLGARRLGFADFAGNRQYMSVANLGGDDRVALFLMDYANRARLKIYGRARRIEPDSAGELPDAEAAIVGKLAVDGYRARVERGFVIDVAAVDWNCPQHITRRFTLDEVAESVAPLQARIAELEAALAKKNDEAAGT